MTETAESKANRAHENDRPMFYQAEGRFVDEHTVEVSGDDGTGSERISGDRIVLAGRSRPMVSDFMIGPTASTSSPAPTCCHQIG